MKCEKLRPNELKEDQIKSQQKIQEKQKKARSQAAVDDSERIFTKLITSMEKKRSESFPSLCVSPGCDDSLSFTVNQHLSFDGVRKSLSGLKKRVEEICEEEFNKIRPEDFCYLTLDPNTAHPQLILSEKNRVVTRSKTQQRYSEHPERFDFYTQVLCKESVCGRCYWEVEWSGDVDISVSYKEISRKGWGDECGFGHNSQSWSLECSSSSVFFMHNNIKTELRGPVTSRIGLYVDHMAGTLSFYSVSDTMRLLHRVHTTFTQPLYAGVIMWSYNSSVRFCDPK
ncbi:stonustoxin subunit beta-like [Tachysurus fulvidraco]|uniref:stonustoxin subunit beta-like n=1 Tax=Tachysurus fulvidraco TaxID=1234273 RepID=UPI001FEE39EC|nr:stonustoxin subunit beta-like [Tachysurus fulvidraco]